MCLNLFTHSSVDGHLGGSMSWLSKIVLMNTGVHVSFRIVVFSGCMPRSEIAGHNIV